MLRSAGIDWGSEQHAVCVVDAAGSVLDRFVVDHRGKVVVLAVLVNIGFLRGNLPIQLPDVSVPMSVLGAWCAATIIRLVRSGRLELCSRRASTRVGQRARTRARRRSQLPGKGV